MSEVPSNSRIIAKYRRLSRNSLMSKDCKEFENTFSFRVLSEPVEHQGNIVINQQQGK
jgi:hypothetical protein